MSEGQWIFGGTQVRSLFLRGALVEAILWSILQVAIGLPLLASYLTNSRGWAERNALWIIALVGAVLFPILFNFIFGSLPLTALRSNLAMRRFGTGRLTIDPPEGVDEVVINSLLEAGGGTLPLRLLCVQERRSLKLAKAIFQRAGTYLFVGVIVAFSGLLFFYSQSKDASPAGNIDAALQMASRLGILLFIEFVAFFFLRQYRAAMDEFRYYEGIHRSREESLTLFTLLEERGQPSELAEAAKAGAFSSKVATLGEGQSTELLEARKIEGSELDAMTKFLDAISALRR